MRLLAPVTVIAGSLAPLLLPIFPPIPVLPPFGLMILLAWALLRPGFWPPWAGFLFGLFDDLASGQPLGSAALIWTVALVVVNLVEQRMVWRDYLQDWLIAAVILIFALAAGWAFAGLAHARPSFLVLVPQMVVSILGFPIIVRLVAALDRWRLAR
jgi:rod shape-determining protein MreD